MVRILDMGTDCIANQMARSWRENHSREQLKSSYSYCIKTQCYEMARSYLMALYGRKVPRYSYQKFKGTIYAYKYPPCDKA